MELIMPLCSLPNRGAALGIYLGSTFLKSPFRGQLAPGPFLGSRLLGWLAPLARVPRDCRGGLTVAGCRIGKTKF